MEKLETFSCQKIDTLVKAEASHLFDSTKKSLKRTVSKAAKKTPFILEDQIAELITPSQNQDQAVKIGIQKRRLKSGKIEVKGWEVDETDTVMIEEEAGMTIDEGMTGEAVMMTGEEAAIIEMITGEADEVQVLTEEVRGVQVPIEDDKMKILDKIKQ
jgi:hypothetical protein